MIIIMGRTGAGKSSQAAELERRHPQLIWLSLGDVLRQSQEPSVKASLSRGELVPDNLVSQIMADAIEALSVKRQPILDGFPRRLSQAKELDNWLKRLNRPIRAVIYLTIRPETAARRLAKRARVDDIAELIAQRLEAFQTETLKTIDYYRQQGLVAEISGEGTVQEVANEIDRVLFRNAAQNI